MSNYQNIYKLTNLLNEIYHNLDVSLYNFFSFPAFFAIIYERRLPKIMFRNLFKQFSFLGAGVVEGIGLICGGVVLGKPAVRPIEPLFKHVVGAISEHLRAQSEIIFKLVGNRQKKKMPLLMPNYLIT